MAQEKLGSSNHTAPIVSVIRNQQDSYHRAVIIVRLFYSAHLWHLAEFCADAATWSRADYINPLWPLFWIHWTGPEIATAVCLSVLASGSILSSMFPQVMAARIVNLVGMILCVSFDNSFGKINHSYHMWMLVGAVMIFLPSVMVPSISRRYRYLSVFILAQGVVLASYSLAGFWKVFFAATQYYTRSDGAFYLESFSYLVADRLLQTSSESYLGLWVIDRPMVGFVILWSGIVLELAAPIAIIKPEIQRAYGMTLIIMHLMCVLIITVNFRTNIVLLVILFIASPFIRDRAPGRSR